MSVRARENKRYSSKVDLDRITKRISKTKSPLTLMFLGQSGLGISTLVDMILFENEPKEIRYFSVDIHGDEKEVTLAETQKGPGLFYRELTTDTSTGLKLNVIDFYGLDDPNTRVIAPIVEMIKRRFASYLESNDIEFMVRANINKDKAERKKDNRIHGCFYLVPPAAATNGDIKNMKVLADIVNLIPVIARADSMTQEELLIAKAGLADDLDSSEVPCYGNVIPAAVETDPESLKVVEVFAQLAEKMPFAVVASTETIQVDGKMVFGREYTWGKVDATEEKISDFYSVQLFVQNNADDMKHRTSDVLYEEYRKARLASLKVTPGGSSS